MIKIHKHIERQLLQDFFLIEGTIDVNADYFIEKIKQGVKEENNRSYRTHLKAEMTAWTYFRDDKEFLKCFSKMATYLDSSKPIPAYILVEAWGIISSAGDWTSRHDHKPNILSGVLYFNDHPQTLDFDEIGVQIKPAKGKFVLFSPELLHKAFPHNSKKNKYGISFNCWLRDVNK